MKHALIVAAMMTMTVTAAFAGKAERDYMEKSVNPAVKTANDKAKAACGCDLHITVDEATFTKKDQMSKARYMAEHIAQDAPKYCTDAASKKAVCQIKSLVLAKTEKTEFKFDSGKATMTTDGTSQCTWAMVTKVIDK